MRTNSVFINTDRGTPVVENQLIRSIYQNTEITEFLDVSETKPPSVDSDFYRLPNVISSRHIAGPIHEEVTKMADTIIDEFIDWKEKNPLRYEVALDMLENSA